MSRLQFMVKLVVMSLGAETAPLIYAIYGLSVGLAATSSSHSALEGNRQVENMPQRIEIMAIIRYCQASSVALLLNCEHTSIE